MIESLIVFFILLLTVPFIIAQFMPNIKCLITYTIFFGTLAIWLYYQHITTPFNQRGNGFSYLFGITAASLFDTSIIVGIINKAIVLFFKSEGYTINIWLILSLVLLDVMLIVLIFPALLEVY
ncbi:MAG: hypothetical protein RMY28_023655 [Nostoc sp. ChiSLP01]|nr:hypothetical protein [Nostoc sp. CmiSLP01]MDZ8289421.1 hypothetical protein [Nostoc sp. ChiSLP01]